MWRINCLILFLCFISELKAEIELITISWNAFKCQSTCIQSIEQNFSAIKGIKKLKIDAAAGTADIEWDPTIALDYQPFRYAAAAVGFNIVSMRVRVKGKISHQSGNMYLISDKDQSRFHLVGPIHIEEGRYIPKYNLETHPLPLRTKEQLLDIEREGSAVTISGPLFLPSHYPLTLVTEQIKTKK